MSNKLPRFSILFLMLLSFAVIRVYSQNKIVDISGIVSEKNSGEFVIGASVMLFADDTSKAPMRGAITNKFGFYSIPKIAPGNYILAAKSIGYTEFRRQITIATEGKNQFNIQLVSQDIKTTEITVQADKETGGTKNISSIDISPTFISKMPSLGGEVDVFRTLQLLPGVKQSSEVSSGLYVRGGSPDQNLTLLDGVIVYNPSHLGGFLSTFNSDALKDIKLIKGAFPAEYGGRLSSVLDMTMKEGNKEKITGSGGISMISSRLTLEGPIDNNSSFMISARRMYLDLLVMLGGAQDAPDYYFYDLNAKVNYKLGDNDRIYLSGYFGRDVFSNNENSNKNDFGINWGNSTGNLRWMHIISSTLFSNFSLIYTDYHFNTSISDNENAKQFDSESLVNDVMFRGELQYFPGEDHKIKSGLEVTFHRFKASALEDLFDESDFEIPQNKINTMDIAFYTQDEWQITPDWETNIGARFYYFQEGNYFNIEPRILSSYKISENLSLKSAFAIANQYLHLVTRNDIFLPTDLWFPSTSTILPSQSWQAVLGTEYSMNNGEYVISLESYYKYMKNIHEYKDSSVFSFGIPLESQFTSGQGEAYGIELFINKRLGSFTGWIGYTLAWTRRQFDELNGGNWFSPRYDQRHDIQIVLNYEFSDSWELGASWVYATGQAFTMPTSTYQFQQPEDYDFSSKYTFSERNGVRMAPFHKLDLNFMRKFTWFGLPFQLSINIYNVYNRQNPFLWYIDNVWDDKTSSYTKQLKQVTLFPIIPSLGLSFKF